MPVVFHFIREGTYSSTRWNGEKRGLERREAEGLEDNGVLDADTILQIGDGREEEK